MEKKITVIPGDGIGPEVIRETVKVLSSIALKYDHRFEFDYCLMGACSIDLHGIPLTDHTLDMCKKSDAVLLGAIGDPKYDNDPGAKVRPEQGLLKLRKELKLFANIRPVSVYSSLKYLSPLKEKQLTDVDFVIFRELTGGIYFGKKETSADGNEASDLCSYHKDEIVRVARLAFVSAQNRRKKLTLVDKANVLDTSRLWRKTVQELCADYPDVTVDYMFVDNAAMQLIINPKQFDVMLTENMFGDILSDEASVITGSIGLLPSTSIGAETALFEPIHGSYPQAAGKDIANPIGAILCAALMMDHFGLKHEADIVRRAVDWTLSNNFVTRDIDPMNAYSTTTIGELISGFIINEKPGVNDLKNMAMGRITII